MWGWGVDWCPHLIQEDKREMVSDGVGKESTKQGGLPTGSVGWRAYGPLDMEGWSIQKNCNDNVSIWISNMEIPLHFPPNTLSKEGDVDLFLLWVSRRAPGRGRTAQSHPGATGGQEAITRVRPLRSFVEILGWNLDFSSVQNLETWVNFS